MNAITQLKATDHTVIAKLIDINEGKTPVVDYSTTVFDSLQNYKKTIANIDGNIIGSQIKNFVETPLVAEKGNQNKAYSSKDDKGVGFGYIFVDYIKKDPLLVFVADKDGADYSYTACTFDKVTKVWKDGTSAKAPVENVNGLISFIVENLTKDVKSFEVK